MSDLDGLEELRVTVFDVKPELVVGRVNRVCGVRSFGFQLQYAEQLCRFPAEKKLPF